MPSESETAPPITSITRMTPHEALRMAMDFEQSAYRFYTDLMDNFAADLRPLLMELAEEELHHYRLLEQVSRSSNLAPLLSESLADAPTTERFSSYVHLPSLEEVSAEEDILAYAEARERIAHEHYGYLAELTPPGPLRDLFAFLRDEETKHLASLERRWSRTYSIP